MQSEMFDRFVSVTTNPGARFVTVLSAVEEVRRAKRGGLPYHLFKQRDGDGPELESIFRVLAIDRLPADARFAGVVEYLSRRLLDVNSPLGVGDVHFMVDGSDFARGQALAVTLVEAFGGFRVGVRMLHGHVVELVAADLPRPTRDGWRLKVSRRSLVAAIDSAIETGLFVLEPGLPLAPELAKQIKAIRRRASKPGEEEEDEDLSRSVGWLAWYLPFRSRSNSIFPWRVRAVSP